MLVFSCGSIPLTLLEDFLGEDLQGFVLFLEPILGCMKAGMGGWGGGGGR